MINCEIKIKHNFKNIDTIAQRLPEMAKEITEDILKNIRSYAIKLEKGHNAEGILCELIDTSDMSVKRKSIYRQGKISMGNV